MTAETMFKEYKNMKREESILRFQLSRFKGVEENDIISAMQLPGFDGSDKVQTGRVSDKTVSTALNYRKVVERENDEWFNYLINRYRFVKEELDFFEQSIAALPEVRSGVMTDLLEGEMKWEAIAEKYHVSRTMIAKYKKAALAELEERYRLRDLQTENYILS